jgi:drug/metabolite transporter (DMT)-like permease
MGRERRWLAYGALLGAIAGIAWSAIFIRWSAVPGPSSAFYRVFIAALVLVPWRTMAWAAAGRNAPVRVPLQPRPLALGLLAGVFFGLDLALYNTAVMRTTATTATLFGNNAPIFVGIGSWLIFGRRPARRFWLGLALAAAGVAVVMVTMRGQAGASGGGDIAGALMAIAAAVFFAGYLLTIERVREEMDTLTLSAVAIAGSVVTVFAVCLIVGAPLTGFPLRTWLALLGLGLISQLGAYLCLTYALGHLPATVTAVGLLAQVPLTALLAVPLLGEPVTAATVAGGLLVLAGIYVVSAPAR